MVPGSSLKWGSTVQAMNLNISYLWPLLQVTLFHRQFLRCIKVWNTARPVISHSDQKHHKVTEPGFSQKFENQIPWLSMTHFCLFPWPDEYHFGMGCGILGGIMNTTQKAGRLLQPHAAHTHNQFPWLSMNLGDFSPHFTWLSRWIYISMIFQVCSMDHGSHTGRQHKWESYIAWPPQFIIVCPSPCDASVS